LHNLIPLAKAMKSKGFEVVFATAKDLKSQIEYLGFAHVPVGINFNGFGDLLVELKNREFISKETSFSLKLFAEPLGFLSVKQLEKFTLGFKPDLIVRDPVEFSSIVISEKYDIRTITINWGYNFPFKKSIEKAKFSIDKLRIHLGLKSDISLSYLMNHSYVNLMPEKWYTEHYHENYNVSYYKTGFYNVISPSIESQVPTDIIYATLGTVFMDDDLIGKYIEAFTKHDEQFVVSYPKKKLSSPSKNIMIRKYVPNSHILPNTKLVITHGGFNTIRQALCFGIPLIITAIAGDQKVHAKKIEELGLGIAISAKDLTSEKLSFAITSILNNDKYRKNALDFKAEIDNLDDIDLLVNKLLKLQS